MGHFCPRLHAIANFTTFRSFATKNRGRNDFSLLTIFRYFFFFSHLPNGALKFNKFCEDCEKSWSQRFAAFYDFSLHFCCSLLPERVSEIFDICSIQVDTQTDRHLLHGVHLDRGGCNWLCIMDPHYSVTLCKYLAPSH